MRDDASQDDTLADEGEDPVIEACLRDALAPYTKALSPEQLLGYRRYLTVFIKTHPSAAPLYERLRGRAALDASAARVYVNGTLRPPGKPGERVTFVAQKS